MELIEVEEYLVYLWRLANAREKELILIFIQNIIKKAGT